MVKLIVGEKALGFLPFREKLTVADEGLSHHGVSVFWGDVKRVKIMHYDDMVRDMRRWWDKFAMKPLKWEKTIIETSMWRVTLDSRVTVRPDDKIKNALGIIGIDDTTDFNSAYLEARKIIGEHCLDKFIDKSTTSGTFDFGDWTSWLMVALIILIIGIIFGPAIYFLWEAYK